MLRSTLSRLLLAVLLCAASSALAQPTLESPHLQDPDLLLDYVTTNADFWLTDAYDGPGGGFYTNIARDGSVNVAWGTNKDVLTQSRDAYAMVRAFQLTGDEAYLDAARSALDFQYAHGWDETYGGWFDRLGESGQPLDPNASKSAFIQHYALLGPMAMVEATGSSDDRVWLDEGYGWMQAHLWDADAASFGYYDRVNRTGAIGEGKSFNATVDAFTTHALQLYTLTGDTAYGHRLDALAANVLDHLVASMPDQAIGFAEKYSVSWQPLSNERVTIMGHVLKTAWVLGRLHALRPAPAYLGAAEALAQHVMDEGYDHDLGGPYKDFDRVTGEMILWGLPDTTKAWWQMEQAVTAGLDLYRHTENAAYLTMADETLAFFMDHFQDPVYGEVYADVTRYGETIPQWGNLFKGDAYKAAYHSIELGYYAYLYGKMFVHGEPVTLHYRFESGPEARSIRLNPLEAAVGEVVIASATWAGEDFTDFDAETRTLYLPAEAEGRFTVTFAPGATTSADPVAEAVAPAELAAPYPNPTNGDAHFGFMLAAPGTIRLAVYDLLGREVAVLVDGPRAAGPHAARLDGADLPSGTYLVRLTTERGFAQTQRVTLLR